MIDYFSEWAQNLTLAIVIVSLFEMLLPNNKTKKYIKVVMGLYILFNIRDRYNITICKKQFFNPIRKYSRKQQKPNNINRSS